MLILLLCLVFKGKHTFCHIYFYNKYHIKDSWDFHNYIKNKKIPKDHVMVSFDVISLYTNIPIDLAMQSITEKWSHIKNHTTIPRNEFIEATKLCLSSTFFQFENNFYS